MLLAIASSIAVYSLCLFFKLLVCLTQSFLGIVCTVLTSSYLIVFIAPRVIRTRRGRYVMGKLGQRFSPWRASLVVVQGRQYKQVRYQHQPTSITFGPTSLNLIR